VAGFEEVHPFEGMWESLKARLELRQMFDCWLPRSRYPYPIPEPDEMVDELRLLDLCQHYRLTYQGGAEDVAKTWDESEQRIADGARRSPTSRIWVGCPSTVAAGLCKGLPQARSRTSPLPELVRFRVFFR
jgi:hypothetical protein